MKRVNFPWLFSFLLLINLIFLSLGVAEGQEKPETPQLVKAKAREKFEIGIHYSQWSIDWIKGLFEDALTKRLGREIGEEMADKIRESHLNLSQAGYRQTLAFDSGGENFGLEVRFYPQGKMGAFSLGFSMEKTRMKLIVEGKVTQEFTDGTYANVEVICPIELSPFTTNLSFRWDMLPAWTVSPYFVCGFGLGALTGTAGYEYSGSYNWAGPQEEIKDSQTKVLKEIEEDIDYNLPNIFYLVQASFGLRVEVNPFFTLRAEAGFWDGFIFRAGVSFRFD